MATNTDRDLDRAERLVEELIDVAAKGNAPPAEDVVTEITRARLRDFMSESHSVAVSDAAKTMWSALGYDKPHPRLDEHKYQVAYDVRLVVDLEAVSETDAARAAGSEVGAVLEAARRAVATLRFTDFSWRMLELDDDETPYSVDEVPS